MTKQEKLTLYKTALQYIAEGRETLCGLCWLLKSICINNNIGVDIYKHLTLESKNQLYTKPLLGGFEELTSQMKGKPIGDYWFPQGEWKEREQLLLNAINILENETT